jgi:hypothetical protein
MDFVAVGDWGLALLRQRGHVPNQTRHVNICHRPSSQALLGESSLVLRLVFCGRIVNTQ